MWLSWGKFWEGLGGQDKSRGQIPGGPCAPGAAEHFCSFSATSTQERIRVSRESAHAQGSYYSGKRCSYGVASERIVRHFSARATMYVILQLALSSRAAVAEAWNSCKPMA